MNHIEDEHVYHYQQTHFVSGMKILALDENAFGMCSSWRLGDCYRHSYLPLKQALSRWGDPKICRCTTASLVALNWSSRPHTTPEIRKQKPQKSMNKHVRLCWRQFWGHSSLVVACTPPQRRKGRYLVAEQLFGMWNIHIHTIVFELSLSAKEERNKEDEQNRNFNSWCLERDKG